VWVNDVLGASLSSSIANSSITADCDGTLMDGSTGYFKTSSTCINLHIYNANTSALMYNSTVSTMLFIANLNRFKWPTVQFVRTKNVTPGNYINLTMIANNGTDVVYDTNNNCTQN
jgi:hypothetical protein